MEARLLRTAVLAATLLSLGASHRTQNFIVTAPGQDLARDICDAAERYRQDLAVDWLGKELPPWSEPCPITVDVGAHLGAGGATSFMFEKGRPFGWTMHIQGSRERILDSVLPHEITHTVFATHFGRPLPRWADEGACTTVEHISEKSKQHDLLINFLTTGRGIAFNHLFAMREYPSDVLPLYAQGYSLARFLLAHGGKRKFIDYVGEGMRDNNWTEATQKHYGFESLSELQVTWLDWVRRGSPPLADTQTLVAQQNGSSGQEVVPQGELVPVGLAAPERRPASQPETVASTDQPVATAKANSKGWYVRIRDEAMAKRRENPAEPRTPPRARSIAISSRSQPNSPPPAVRQAVSRPQPVTLPQQETILEWSRSNSPAPAAPPQPRTYWR